MAEIEQMKKAILAALAPHQRKYGAHESCRGTYVRRTGIDWFDVDSKTKPNVRDVIKDYAEFHPPYISAEELFEECKAFGSYSEFEAALRDITDKNEMITLVGERAGEYGDYRDAKPTDIDHSVGRSTGMSNGDWLERQMWRERVNEACKVRVILKRASLLKEFEFDVAASLFRGYEMKHFQVADAKTEHPNEKVLCAVMVRCTGTIETQ